MAGKNRVIFSCNNLSKMFDDDLLFENISFGMEEGERLGIIGKNGVGKTTLLRILAQREPPDSGDVVFNNTVRFEYLEQIPQFDSDDIALDAVMSAKPELYCYLNKHKELCTELERKYDSAKAKMLEGIIQKIDNNQGWNLESESQKVLTMLGVDDFYKNVHNLSGGQRKRVALARAIISEPDLLILDEPTNHLDADSVQWLQDRLQNANSSLLLVTHDRYFLDAVSTRIVEIDKGRIFSYPGNYEQYLELKESFIQAKEAENEHIRSTLRKELAWLQKGAKARRTKQKSRIDWISRMSAEAKKDEEKKIKIELGRANLGKRIIEAYNIGKSIGGKLLFDDFTYIAKPGDRIGIIGPNGSGKTTLLNVLAGATMPDRGRLKNGLTVKIGFFRQELEELDSNQSIMGSLREIAEFIDVGFGRDRYLSTRDLLTRFLFPYHQHTSLISTLSGGEKRRLGLLRVLMGNPNVLFLDEPTNDLDINTLHALEDYLENFFGTLLVVSHDRAFLDRTVDFIYAFIGNGKIKEYPGNYSNYLEKKEIEAKNKSTERLKKEDSRRSNKETQQKKKLSYAEQREYEQLETEIERFEQEKQELEAVLKSGKLGNYKLLEEKSHRIAELEKIIDELTARWLEIADLAP